MTFKELIVNILSDYGEDMVGIKEGIKFSRDRNGWPLPHEIFNKPLENNEFPNALDKAGNIISDYKWYIIGGITIIGAIYLYTPLWRTRS